MSVRFSARLVVAATLVLAFLLPLPAARADEAAALAGIWKCVSQVFEFQDGSPPRPLLGEHPLGYLILTPQGRMMAFVEGEGRKAPASDAEAVAAFRSMIAYTGVYTVHGNSWTTKVDGAWNPAWKGTEQVRTFSLQGDRLEVVTMWQPQVNFGGKVGRALLVWERVR